MTRPGIFNYEFKCSRCLSENINGGWMKICESCGHVNSQSSAGTGVAPVPKITTLQLEINELCGQVASLTNENASLRSELEALRKENEWVKCSDRLPEEMQDVLFYHNSLEDLNGVRAIFPPSHGWYCNGNFYSYATQGKDKMNATHWRTIPTPTNL